MSKLILVLLICFIIGAVFANAETTERREGGGRSMIKSAANENNDLVLMVDEFYKAVAPLIKFLPIGIQPSIMKILEIIVFILKKLLA